MILLLTRKVKNDNKDLSFEDLTKEFKKCYALSLNQEFIDYSKYSIMDSIKLDLALTFVSAIDDNPAIQDEVIKYLREVYHPDLNRIACQLIGQYYPDVYRKIKDSVIRLSPQKSE